MRILHVANFSWFHSKGKRVDNIARYYIDDRLITNGLIRNGHTVLDFSYRDTARFLSPLGMGKKLGARQMNHYLIETAQHYQPDLLLLGHSEIVTAATLATLRQELPHCKIAQWWVDWFTDYSISHLRVKLPLLDAFYATTAPSYYRPLLAAAGANIPPLYYLPNITDSSVHTERAHSAAKYDYDLLFIGADAAERAALLHTLQQLPDIRRGFFGFDGQRKLTGAEFIATFGRSKMGLNLSRATDIPLYSSNRLWQLTANGCMAITPRTPQMNILFSEKEVAYYDNESDLPDIINHYNSNDGERRAIAEAGWRRAHSSYNGQRVTKFMLEAATAAAFSEEYEWLSASK